MKGTLKMSKRFTVQYYHCTPSIKFSYKEIKPYIESELALEQ